MSIKLFNKLNNKYLSNEVLDESRRYESLAPSSDVGNGEEYIAALEWAIQQDDITNIAVSGPYGSGKSSIIKTFLKRNKNIPTLNISLAAFNLEEMQTEVDGDDNKKINKLDEEKLEIGILKQLFYKESYEIIPQSRYRKLHKEKLSSNIFTASVVEILIIIGLLLFLPNIFVKMVEQITIFLSVILNFFMMDNLCCDSFLFAFIISCIPVALFIFSIAYLIMRIKINFYISKINLLDKATLETDDTSKESIFNKNMDEIVYFFEATKYKIVVIEDLDRFDSTNIFVKLRDLNGVINNYTKIKRKVVFIYAIRDDMFGEEERTKFFDFIIPIIPYISSTNSGEIMREKLGFTSFSEKSECYDISAQFVSMVSPYISDMRILTCICNEFNIYKNTLKNNQNLKLTDEHMLAMIVFKNLYPRDFAELENGYGIVKMAFDNKEKYIKLKCDDIESDINNYRNRLERINTECLNNVRELKIIFISQFLDNKFNSYEISVDNKRINIDNFLDDSYDMTQLKNKKITLYYYAGSYYSSSITVDLKEKNKDYEEFFSRYSNLKNGKDESKNKISINIEKREKEIMALHKYSLSYLISKYDVDTLFDKDIQNNKLLIFLLRHGYIDEQYEDYINYFHPNSITHGEMNFILSVRNYEPIGDYNYELKNISRIYDRLQDFEFGQKEILNYNLADYLLKEKANSKAFYEWMGQLSNHSQTSMDFIKAYVERGRNLSLFIRYLCKENGEYWKDIIEADDFSLDSQYKYFLLMIEYADIEDVLKQNIIKGSDLGIVYDFVISMPDILQKMKYINVSRQKALIQSLDIHFSNVEIEGISDELLQMIFDDAYYVINRTMIQRIFEWKHAENIDDLNKANYTSIKKLEYDSLLEYVHSDFMQYVRDLIIISEDNTEESMEAVEDILERLVSEDVELCIEVLKKEHTYWENIGECCDGVEEESSSKQIKTVWSFLLRNKCVAPTWNNFSTYYNRYGLANALVEFVNSSIDELLSDDYSNLSEDVKFELLQSELSADTFEKYITNMPMDSFNGKLEEFEDEKILIMISNNFIPFNKAYFTELSTISPDLRLLYIKCNKEQFFEMMNGLKITNAELIDLLNGSDFNNIEKEKLASCITVDMVNTDLALVISNITCNVSKDIVEAAWDILEEEKKYQLLLNHINVYKDNELALKFKELNHVYHGLADRDRRHKVTLYYDNYNYIGWVRKDTSITG